MLRPLTALALVFAISQLACSAGQGSQPTGGEGACMEPLLRSQGSDGGNGRAADDANQFPEADTDRDAATDADESVLDAGGPDNNEPMSERICSRHQRLFVCDLANARDLAGTALRGGGSVPCGRIYRGPPLAGLSAQGCRLFAELGIRTIVDLRTSGESGRVPEAACTRSAGAKVVFAPMPIPYGLSAADYIADLDATASVAEAFRALGDATAYPIYIHCTWGRDRTGVLTAVVLSALGATREEILREYLLSQSSVGAFPSSLAATLDEIDRRGGIEAYLRAAGITAEQLATLRQQASQLPSAGASMP